MADDEHNRGLSERPQRALTGAPLKGSIADWADEIASESTEAPAEPAKTRARKPASSKETRGPETLARKADATGKAAKPRKAAAKSKAEPKAERTSRGTSMGGKASARERAGAGLNPVAGFDMSM